jgi:hypothetical protein
VVPCVCAGISVTCVNFPTVSISEMCYILYDLFMHVPLGNGPLSLYCCMLAKLDDGHIGRNV